MSTHYLIEGHTSPVTSSDIQSVHYNTDHSALTGGFVIRVSEDMPLDAEPSSFSALLSGKYASMLTFYSVFANVAFEDFTDTPNIDFTNSTGVHSGVRGCTKLNPTGVLRTTMAALGSTPAQCVVLWESFEIVNTNPANGRLTREYRDQLASDFTVEVSFNNGSTWTTATDQALLTIAGPDQGNQLILRVTNTSGLTRYLGSWAVLY